MVYAFMLLRMLYIFLWVDISNLESIFLKSDFVLQQITSLNMSFLKIYFELEDDWFTIWCWFLPYSSMNQPQVYMCSLPLEPPFRPPPLPTPLGSHRAPDWATCVIQPIPTGGFTYGNVYVSMLLSHFIPPSPSLTVSTVLFSVCISIASLRIGSSTFLNILFVGEQGHGSIAIFLIFSLFSCIWNTYPVN